MGWNQSANNSIEFWKKFIQEMEKISLNHFLNLKIQNDKLSVLDGELVVKKEKFYLFF